MATLTAPAYDGGASKTRKSLSFIIAASSGGTLIEWYDFYLYGVLAAFFATHFFPGDMRQGFLYSLGIFWTGFVVRPFGAVVFGHLGDLIGRKYTFMRGLEADYGRGPEDLRPDLRLKRNLENEFLIDRELQKTKTFTGIVGINTQDVAVQEGMAKR